MLYGISILPKEEKGLCEYDIGAFACIAQAEYEFRTDIFTKNLCKEHLEEFKRTFQNESDSCFDESIINTQKDHDDL